jgi:tetratricopeptide (TPR) repeat protein
MGRIYTLTNDWEQSEEYYQKAIRISQESRNYKLLKSALFEVSGLYIHTRNFKSATACIQHLDSIKDFSTPFDYAKACLTIGNQYRAVNQYDSAIVYLNKASNEADPFTRQSAYQALYYLYENQNKYKEAIPYNNKYWTYADSVQKLNNKKAVIDIVSKYRNEKLLNETTLLRLRNTRIVMTGLILFLLFAIVTAVIVIIYQRRLLLRNKTINIIRQQLAELMQKVEDNENTIQNNKAIIAQQAALLQQQENTQDELIPQKNDLEQINQELEQANQRLKEMIREKTRMLSAKDEKLIAIQRLADERKEHPNILVRLKQDGKHLNSDEDWEELIETTDRMYGNFSKRLLLAHPSLKRNDINLCCLLKQGYDSEKMSELLSITDESLTKRKQRLKKRLDSDKKWENGELEALIRSF